MSTGLIDIMKRASMDAMDNAQMCDLRYGKVVSTSPLKVQVTNLFTIPEALLVVPQHLTDYSVDITIDWNTEDHTHTHNISDSFTGGGSASSETHKHEIKGTNIKITEKSGMRKDRYSSLAYNYWVQCQLEREMLHKPKNGFNAGEYANKLKKLNKKPRTY